MRMVLRVVSASLVAAMYGMDELRYKVMPCSLNTRAAYDAAYKAMKAAQNAVHTLADSMADNGEGE